MFQHAPADRNKTDLTLGVVEAASAWLSNIGAKCLETEVAVGPKWIADVAAFWSPTPTEAINAKLIPRKPRGSYYGMRLPMTAAEQEYADWREKLASLPQRITIALEVKTSRSDFQRDKKFTRIPVADMQVLAYTKGILDIGEVPPHWWLLEHSARDGSLLSVARRAPVVGTSVEQRLVVIANIAERRHNRTANAFFAALNKRRAVDYANYKAETRLSRCMRTVLAIARGEKAVSDALSWHFSGRDKMPQHLVDELTSLHGRFPARGHS